MLDPRIEESMETPKMTNENDTNKMLDDDDKNEPINAVGDKEATAQKLL